LNALKLEEFCQRESLRPPPYPASTRLHRLISGAAIGDEKLDVLSHVQLASQLGYHKKRLDAVLIGAPEPPIPEDKAVQLALVHEQEPAWLDPKAVLRAQAFWHKYLAVYSGALFALLIHGFAINRFSEVLVQAGYAKTPWASHVRFRDTGAAIHLWMTQDMTNPNSAARRSVQQVRWMHAFARSVVQLPGGLWEREEEIEKHRLTRLKESPDPSKAYLGVPLSQYDLAMTLLGFSSVAMSYMIDDYGVEMTPQNKEDLTHFWRYVGYHLGIREEYNSCTYAAEAEQMAREMFNFSPIFARGARASTPLLSQSLMKGFGKYTGIPNSILVALPVIVGENRSWSLDVFLPKDAHSSESVLGDGEPKKLVTFPHNQAVKLLVRNMHRMMPCFPWVRMIMNAAVRFALNLMCHYPRLATWVEANVLPCVSMPVELGLRLLGVVFYVVKKSNLFTPVLLSCS